MNTRTVDLLAALRSALDSHRAAVAFSVRLKKAAPSEQTEMMELFRISPFGYRFDDEEFAEKCKAMRDGPFSITLTDDVIETIIEAIEEKEKE